jgi:hypothetical protein
VPPLVDRLVRHFLVGAAEAVLAGESPGRIVVAGQQVIVRRQRSSLGQ